MYIKMKIEIEVDMRDTQFPGDMLEHCVTLKPCNICGSTKDLITFRGRYVGVKNYFRNVCKKCAKEREVAK